MGLAYNKLDVVGSTMFSYVDGVNCDLFRLASGWMLSRIEMVRLINGFMTGPSTMADTQMNRNNPIFFKALRYWMRLRNPTNNPTRYKIYKCTLLADAIGGTQSIYTEATPGFNVSQNYMGANLYATTGNWPGSSYWKFWQQRGIYGAGANSATVPAYKSFLSDQMLVQNDGSDNIALPPCGDTVVTTTGSGLSSHACFESMPDPSGALAALNQTAFLHRGEPLTKIFPAMRKQLRVECVASGRLGAYQSKQHRFSHRMPTSVHPLDYILNDSTSATNFSGRSFMKGISHFFIIRAYCPPPAAYRPSAGGAASNTFLTEWSSQCPQLICDWKKRFQCRVAGDTFANYAIAYDAESISSNSSYYMGPNQGGFRNGFRYVDSSGAAPAQSVFPVDGPGEGEAFYRNPPLHVNWGASGPLATPAAANSLYLN